MDNAVKTDASPSAVPSRKKRMGWLIIEVLIFLTIMCVVSGILYLAAELLSAILHIDTHDTGLDSRFTLLAETASAIGCLAGLWIVARVHKRVFPDASPQGIGLALKGHARELWAGIGVAGGLYAIGFLTVLLLGGAKVTDASVHLPALLQTLVFFFTVAVFEEGMCRGFLLGRMIDAGINKFAALVLSSAVFSALHLANPGFTALPFINLLLAGILLGSAYIYTRNLWFAIALHWFWNWLQGPVLGFEVSGNAFGESLLTLDTSAGSALLNGGPFGFEGSLICTVLMLAAIWLIIRYYNRGMVRD